MLVISKSIEKVKSFSTRITDIVLFIFGLSCVVLSVLGAFKDFSSLLWLLPLGLFFSTWFFTNAMQYGIYVIITFLLIGIAFWLLLFPVVLFGIVLPWWIPIAIAGVINLFL